MRQLERIADQLRGSGTTSSIVQTATARIRGVQRNYQAFVGEDLHPSLAHQLEDLIGHLRELAHGAPAIDRALVLSAVTSIEQYLLYSAVQDDEGRWMFLDL